MQLNLSYRGDTGLIKVSGYAEEMNANRTSFFGSLRSKTPSKKTKANRDNSRLATRE